MNHRSKRAVEPGVIGILNAALQAGELSVATIYEAAQSEYVSGQIAVDPGIRALWAGATAAGLAFTVQGKGGDNLALHRAIAVAPHGSVLVADLESACNGHWGEVMTVAAQARGIAGLVIDGGVRDTSAIRSREFPVFSRNNSVSSARKEFPGIIGGPIQIGGVQVATRDLIVGDADGVVVIREPDVLAVLARAYERSSYETSLFEALRMRLTTTVQLLGLDSE